MSERDESEQTGQGESEERVKAKEAEKAHEEAKEQIKELEQQDQPPEKLEDWPTGPAMYETYGGPEGEHSYDEGPEAKLGPASLRHHEGGDVSVEGEKVDEPEEYKGDPIPGGPTDPSAPGGPDESEGSEGAGDSESGEGDEE